MRESPVAGGASQVGLALANPACISPGSRRLAEMAVLGQHLGDLHHNEIPGRLSERLGTAD
jgi:hypothetical protein